MQKGNFGRLYKAIAHVEKNRAGELEVREMILGALSKARWKPPMQMDEETASAIRALHRWTKDIRGPALAPLKAHLTDYLAFFGVKRDQAASLR